MSDTERTILGSCLYAEAVGDIAATFSPDDFTTETHKSIFDAVQRLVAKGVCPDILTLAGECTAQPSYLAELFDDTPSVANVGYHIKKFKSQTERTRLLDMASKVSEMITEPVEDIRSAVERSLESKESTTAQHVGKALKKAFDGMEVAYQNRGAITGIPTGVRKIDAELSGLHKTDMIILAARPSIGKTAFALQVVAEACVKKKVPTLFLSLEMSAEQLSSRLVLSMSRINVSKARNGLFDEHEWGKMTVSAGELNQAPLYIDDSAGVTVEAIAAKAKAAKMRHDIGLLVVDYLGLVSGKGTEYEKITNASQQIKTLAKRLEIPVVCVHQLNRSNLNNRPTMNELRSSGQLEQDGDVIMLLHREKKDPIEPCEIIIEKNRHGATGIVPQQWNGPFNLIEEGISHEKEY